MRRWTSYICVGAFTVLLAMVFINAKRPSPVQIARALRKGMTPAECEDALQLGRGAMNLTNSGSALEYTAMDAGWIALIIPRDEVTLLFDLKTNRLTDVWYERVWGVDETDEHGLELGTGKPL